MTTVACVLRTGGIYDARYVARLAAGVRRWSSPDQPVVCLTDDVAAVQAAAPDVETRPIETPAGWWAKMWLWRRGTWAPDERVVYIDLDSAVTGPLAPLLEYDGPPLICREFNSALALRLRNMPGSAVILWRGDALARIWDAFAAGPEQAMRQHARRMDSFIGDHLPAGTRWLQDVFPGVVACAKRGFSGFLDTAPADASIITTFARPKPHELPAAHWFRRLWDDPMRDAS